MIATTENKSTQVENPGLLFEWGLKSLLFAAFFELVLYRLVSRLGMHLGKLAEKYEAVRIGFRTLSSLGFRPIKYDSHSGVFDPRDLTYVQKMRTKLWVGQWDKVGDSFVRPPSRLYYRVFVFPAGDAWVRCL